MTAHRLYSWRWYPHDWLRFAMPWRIKQNSARIIDEVEAGRRALPVAHRRRARPVRRGGEARHPHRRHQPLHAREHARVHAPAAVHARTGRSALAWKAARRTFGRAEAVTTPTRKAADFLEKFTGLRGVHAISCGIDAHNYTPDFAPRTENRILFVGRVTGEKQIDVLLKAVAAAARALDAQARDRRRRRPAEEPAEPRRRRSASPTASPSPAT